MKKAFQHNLVMGLTCLALAINVVIGYRVYSQETAPDDEMEALEKLSVMMRVLHLIQQDYVDPDKVDYEQLIYGAMDGMVSSLDPFSSFLRPDDFQDMMDSTEGQFGGLGVVVTVKDGHLTVVTAIAGTPGSRAGLLAGDQIVAIDGESVDKLDLSDSVHKLKGEPGTEVTIRIYRPDTDETLEKTIVRAVIEVPSVKDAQLLEDRIGYIRIVQFDEKTADLLEEKVMELQGQEMSSLILDLRNNPGGLLTAAVDVCSLFLEPKQMVVATEGRRPSQVRKYYTDNGRKFLDVPIVVLVNKGSASAAEIVAGCFQDVERAVLVGDTTFGKGSVQNIIKLPDGSALRLTTAMYYTPKRRVIHEHGIDPDIEVKITPEQVRILVERQGELGDEAVPDQEADPQLRRAVETLESYEIYRKAEM
jgi:carboxyl-terminal processing protease